MLIFKLPLGKTTGQQYDTILPLEELKEDLRAESVLSLSLSHLLPLLAEPPLSSHASEHWTHACFNTTSTAQFSRTSPQ